MVTERPYFKLKDSLISKLLPRYFSVPQVKEWLLDRHTAFPLSSSDLSNGLSYACMYYPLASLPPGLSAPFPLSRPFLDIGDFILCQKFYDGIAVGTVFKEDERHALATLRDHLFPPSPRLSSQPKVRRFAVDMRKDYLEIIEFAWMLDDSLVVSCRQMRPSHDTNQMGNYFWGDILYYQSLPELFQFTLSPYLWLSLRETPTTCFHCNTNSLSPCTCPPVVRQNVTSSSIQQSNNSSIIPSRNKLNSSYHRDENRLVDTWRNYHQNVFASKQAGNFYATWSARNANNDFVLIRSPSQPIHYQFVTGSQEDTLHLISRYLEKTQLGQTPRLSGNSFGPNGNPPGQSALLPSSHSHASNTEDPPIQQQQDNELNYNQNQPECEVAQVVIPKTDQTLHSQLPVTDQIPYDPNQIVKRERRDPAVTPSTECTESPPTSIQSLPISQALPQTHIYLQSDIRHNGISPYSSSDPSQIPQIQSIELPENENDHETKKFMSNNEKNDPMCAKCHRCFRKRGNLVRHIENVHLKKKPYRCRLCLTKFGYNYHLKRHYQSKHHVTFDNKCPVCGHDAGNNGSLVQHMVKCHRVSAE